MTQKVKHKRIIKYALHSNQKTFVTNIIRKTRNSGEILAEGILLYII
jgi:hypothetical protein